MKTRVTLRFLEESSLFSFRYTCDDCAHFAESTCGNRYPLGERSARELGEDDELSFCKEFEVS